MVSWIAAPEDVLPIYRRQIERTLDRKNNRAYGGAVALLRKIRDLMVRTEDETGFSRYLVSLRAAHKPKRNFMKLLGGAGWQVPVRVLRVGFINPPCRAGEGAESR